MPDNSIRFSLVGEVKSGERNYERHIGPPDWKFRRWITLLFIKQLSLLNPNLKRKCSALLLDKYEYAHILVDTIIFW